MKTAVALRDEKLSGWGLRNAGRCRVARPRTPREIVALFADVRAVGGTIGLRGAGCSYGDAALNRAAVVLETTAMDRILAWNSETGQVTVEPGVTLEQLWRRILPDGWWPAVVPGTSAVTVGGAASANIHGKNNWHAGCFGDHVLAFDLSLPSGETLTCSREQHPDLFRAAIGGWGLLGCFTSLTLQAHKVHSGDLWEIQSAHPSLDALLAALEAATEWASELVAWIDTGARGGHLGRGLLRAGRELTPDEDPDPSATLTVEHQIPRPGMLDRLPHDWLPRLGKMLTSPRGIRLANRVQRWRGGGIRMRRPHLETYVGANFTLDRIPNWRESYRPGGLFQHQSFVPAAIAAETFRAILERAHKAGQPPTLAVLKKHRPSDFLLNYLPDGYSLALDFPVRAGEESQVLALLRGLNDLLVEAGGACYFAKDSTATAAQVRQMFGDERLGAFRALKEQYDPDALLCTDLYRRAIVPAIAAPQGALSPVPRRTKTRPAPVSGGAVAARRARRQ